MISIESLKQNDYRAYRCCKCDRDLPCVTFTNGGVPTKCLYGYEDRILIDGGWTYEDSSNWEETEIGE